jgi:hypothetical protein
MMYPVRRPNAQGTCSSVADSYAFDTAEEASSGRRTPTGRPGQTLGNCLPAVADHGTSAGPIHGDGQYCPEASGSTGIQGDPHTAQQLTSRPRFQSLSGIRAFVRMTAPPDRTQEVAGSSPASSISRSPRSCGGFCGSRAASPDAPGPRRAGLVPVSAPLSRPCSPAMARAEPRPRADQKWW